MELVLRALPAPNLDVVLVFGWEYLQTNFPFLESEVSFPLSRAFTADAVAGSKSWSLMLSSPLLMDWHP